MPKRQFMNDLLAQVEEHLKIISLAAGASIWMIYLSWKVALNSAFRKELSSVTPAQCSQNQTSCAKLFEVKMVSVQDALIAGFAAKDREIQQIHDNEQRIMMLIEAHEKTRNQDYQKTLAAIVKTSSNLENVTKHLDRILTERP